MTSVDCRRNHVFKTDAVPDKAKALVERAMEALAACLDDENLLFDFDLCLTEACANVVKHAYPKGPPGDLEVRLRIDRGESVAVEVSDWGAPARFEANPIAPEPTAETGRGLFIISRLMDVLDVKRHNGKKTVFFMKRIGAEAWKA